MMHIHSTLGRRGDELTAPGGMLDLFTELFSAPYHVETNATGIISMGVSENAGFCPSPAVQVKSNMMAVRDSSRSSRLREQTCTIVHLPH